MDFAIVHFQTENSVAVVPSIWVAGESNLCYWPSYRASRLETAVKEREKSTVDWECINNVRVLHFYDNYHKARLNLSKAEHDTSALESENEIFGNLKRIKIVSDIS
nr:uncharacterized protein LOC124819205 [Hydra vulgaris]